MVRQRVRLEVYVDLDPYPGAFDSPVSAKEAVEKILKDRIEHYHPQVYLNMTSGR